MEIKILGPGCRNCRNLAKHTHEALARLGLDAQVTEVTDYPTIVGYGILQTPGLVVDEEVVVSGRVPGADEIAELLAARS